VWDAGITSHPESISEQTLHFVPAVVPVVVQVGLTSFCATTVCPNGASPVAPQTEHICASVHVASMKECPLGEEVSSPHFVQWRPSTQVSSIQSCSHSPHEASTQTSESISAITHKIFFAILVFSFLFELIFGKNQKVWK
jgi:hypothetical protein